MKWQTEAELERPKDDFFVGVPTCSWHYGEFLEHYGIKGMRWGFRTKEYQKKGYSDRYEGTDRQANPYAVRRSEQQTSVKQTSQKTKKKISVRKAAIIGAAAAVALIGAYAAYKYTRVTKATAYANTLNKLLNDNYYKLGSSLDRSQQIERVHGWAKSNSSSLKQARYYNKLFGKKLTGADRKTAVKLYRGRNHLDKFYEAANVRKTGINGLIAKRKMARSSAAWFRKTGIRV